MILERIVVEKKKQIQANRARVSLKELAAKAYALRGNLRSFKEAIALPGKINLIGEIKKASPSQGLFRRDFNPVEIARDYWTAGAVALSILTEEKFFQGGLADLKIVRQAVNLPLLRKDFIIDEYQIYESICAGADSILLISQLLTAKELTEFYSLSSRLNLDVICEVHREEDLDKVLPLDSAVIGINNRDLKTFNEDLQVTARLIKKIPKTRIVVSESAIKKAEDVQYLKGLGVNAVLIGEAFMTTKDIPAKVKEIMGND